MYLQALAYKFWIAVFGYNDDPKFWVVTFKYRNDVQPIHNGHIEIQQQDIGQTGGQFYQEIFSISSSTNNLDREGGLLLQCNNQRIHKKAVVICNK